MLHLVGILWPHIFLLNLTAYVRTFGINVLLLGPAVKLRFKSIRVEMYFIAVFCCVFECSVYHFWCFI